MAYEYGEQVDSSGNITHVGSWGIKSKLKDSIPLIIEDLRALKDDSIALPASHSHLATVRLASTANVVLLGLQVIDGVQTIEGDEVLLKDQTDSTQNGLYFVHATAWVRSATLALINTVTSGATNIDTILFLTTPDTITIGTSKIVYGASIEDGYNKATVDANIATGIATAEMYSNAQDVINLASSKAYSDTQDASNLVTAKAYADTKVASLISSAPATLDTLNELATALGNDPNFATTMTTLIGTKAPLVSPALTGSPTINGVVPVITTDSRLSDARTPVAHSQAWSTITGTPTSLSGYGIASTDALFATVLTGYDTVTARNIVLATYAPLANPTLTGVPLAPTATAGTSSTQLATTAFVGSALGNYAGATTSAELGFVHGVTSAIQTQLGTKANSATTLAGYGITDAYLASTATTALALKANLASPTFTGQAQVTTTGASFGLVVGENVSSIPNAHQILVGYNLTGNYGSIQAIQENVGSTPLILQQYGGNLGVGTIAPMATFHSTGSTILGVSEGSVTSAQIGNSQAQVGIDETNNTLRFDIKTSTGVMKHVVINYNTGAITLV